MYTHEDFKQELALIKCPDIKKFTEAMLKKALPYFYSYASSSSGKYHPAQSNGEGGLVRHTKAAVYFANAFCRSFELEGREADLTISATILHDLCKYGIPGGKHTTPMHDKESADYVLALGKAYLGSGEAGTFTADDLVVVCQGIAHHMGPWTKHNKKKVFPDEYTKSEMVVHIADMASTQKEVGISYLSEPTVGIG